MNVTGLSCAALWAALVTVSLAAAMPLAHGESTEAMTLSEAYRLALAQSERVAIAEREVTVAGVLHKETRTEISPDVDAFSEGSLQREVLVGGEVFVPARQYVAGARVQQPLFRRGYGAARAAGRHDQASARARVQRAREQLARDVADVFTVVIRDRKLLELARSAVERAEEQFEHARRRVRAGAALRTAELLALQDVKRAERQLVEAERNLGSAEIVFARIVGGAPPPALDLPPAPSLPDIDRALQRAEERADLEALERRAAAARAEERAARGSRWWPRLDFEATVQYLYPEVLGQSVEWRATGVLTIPLFDRGREFTAVALQEQEVEIARLRLEEQGRVVAQEVELAALQLASARQSAELAEEQLEAAREHYELINKQFRLGATTFLEVTNAQAILVEAENAREVARMDRIRAAYDYLYAIGALDLS